MNKSKILIARSNEENAILEKKLSVLGFAVLAIDLVKYRELAIDYNLLANYNLMIITSKYVAKKLLCALEVKAFSRSVPKIWCVGEESANILRAKQYKVSQVFLNAKSLKEHLLLTNPDLPAIYLSGEFITCNLPSFVKRYIVYNIEYANTLNASAIETLSLKIDYILLFSSHSATMLVKLLNQYNLLDSIRYSTIIALSEKIIDKISNQARDVIICQNMDSIINYLSGEK